MKIVVAAALAAASVIAPASAATYQFTLTGDHDTATFTLPSSPTDVVVDQSSAGNDYFTVSDVAGTYAGDGQGGNAGTNTDPVTVADIQFYQAADGGGIEVNFPASGPQMGFGIFSLEGEQLFTGDPSAPTFRTGTFTFTNDFFYGPVNETLVITDLDAAGAVPEPATWGLMLLGAAAVGAALRRRRGLAVKFA